MPKFSLSSFLDWLQRGHWVLTVAVPLFLGTSVGQSVKALLLTTTSIPPVWVTPIWLAATALTLALFQWWIRKRAYLQQQTFSLSNEQTLPEQRKAVSEFYGAFDGPIVKEVEGNILKMAEGLAGPERERFLVKYAATVGITSWCEIFYLTVWGSQLRLMEDLNTRAMSIDQIRQEHYDPASAQYPSIYSQYPLDPWLNLLHAHGMTEQKGSTVSITPRGREYLKWMIHEGKSSKNRGL